MKCLIHIGMHKTGSSSIQSALKGYDDGENVYADLNSANHSGAILMAFSDDDYESIKIRRNGWSNKKKDIKKKKLSLIESQLKRKVNGCLIFSGEGAGLLSEESSSRFIDLIKDYCDEIKVVAYLRHPLDYAKSAFQQRVKSGIKDVPEKIPPSYRFRLEKYINAVGIDNVIVKSFAKESLLNGDVVQDFFDEFGLHYVPKGEGHINQSMSSDALRFVYWFNRTNPLFSGDEKLSKCYVRFVNNVRKVLQGRDKIVNDAFISQADYSDCDWVFQNFGIRFDPPGNQDQSESLKQWMDLSNISSESIDSLLGVLRGCDVHQDFGRDPVKIINRLFYLELQGKLLSV